MSVFQDSRTKEVLSEVLLAFIEEWGVEHVSVCAPLSWREFGIASLGPVRLNFVEQQAISIHVDCDSAHLKYEAPVLCY